MKKTAFILAACMLSSLGFAAKKPKAPVMKTEIDTVSYAIGVAVGRDFSKQLNQLMDGQQNTELILQGFQASLRGTDAAITGATADSLVQNYVQANQAQREQKYIDDNKKFLTENAKKQGIVSLPSGLQYEVIIPSDGAHPADTSIVKVHYEGKLIDGTVFDSSIQRGEAIEFPLNRVIPGWTEGVQHMTVGSTYKLYIPAELGYGAQPMGNIPPNSTLIFDVQLLEIK
ncbi:MAG: FKBP-type peptidyl-prolyl cis-trans isomerase [Prevotellaceae bacterium]|jgi:FKBP-type peptidyl-prolyl cis-trans isomerase|nr:FKBP-type peptidyl-prolyl cis-trans isomerase [Prevotellaceae bacterium]